MDTELSGHAQTKTGQTWRIPSQIGPERIAKPYNQGNERFTDHNDAVPEHQTVLVPPEHEADRLLVLYCMQCSSEFAADQSVGTADWEENADQDNHRHDEDSNHNLIIPRVTFDISVLSPVLAL